MNCPANKNPVSVLLVEDDYGHARLVERTLQRGGLHDDLIRVLSCRGTHLTRRTERK